MATQSQAPATQPFIINLNIDATRNCVDAHGAFENQMIVGNTARFVAGAAHDVLIEFTSMPAVDDKGQPVPSDLLPFGKAPNAATIRNPGPNDLFPVVYSCRAMMQVTIITPDGKKVTCPMDTMGQWGTTVCTGGGANPVTCH